jgi:hydroxyacylglutathione hydrolase
MYFSRSLEKRGRQIVEGVYYFGESGMLDCNQYILKSTNGDLTMIDAGNGKSFDGLMEGMKRFGLDIQKIKRILLTHEHVDHISGIYRIRKEFSANMPEIIALKPTAHIIRTADEDAVFPQGLGLTATQFGVKMEKMECTEVKEGDEIDCKGFKLSVLETPGHSVGSATYIENKLGIIFPGDVVFPGGSFGRYDFPGGSKSVLKASIERLTSYKALTYLCAGHMAFETNASQSIKMSLHNIDYF